MFGDLKIEVPIGGGEARSIFSRGRLTDVNKNTTISAVTVLSRTNAKRAPIDHP